MISNRQWQKFKFSKNKESPETWYKDVGGYYLLIISEAATGRVL